MKHREFLEGAHIHFTYVHSLDDEITTENFRFSVNLDDYSEKIVKYLKKQCNDNDKIFECDRINTPYNCNLYIADLDYVKLLPYYKKNIGLGSSSYYLIQENEIDEDEGMVTYSISEIPDLMYGTKATWICEALVKYIKEKGSK